MDEESIVTIREELSDDFFSLAESHLGAVQRLVERLLRFKLNIGQIGCASRELDWLGLIG